MFYNLIWKFNEEQVFVKKKAEMNTNLKVELLLFMQKMICLVMISVIRSVEIHFFYHSISIHEMQQKEKLV